MAQDERKQGGVSRRNFIKGAAAAGAAIATGGTLVKGANAQRRATRELPASLSNRFEVSCCLLLSDSTRPVNWV